MKTVMYIIDAKYEKKETMQVAGVLFKILLKTIRALRRNQTKYTNKEFAIFPVNTFQIAKDKKIILAGNGKGVAVLEAIDEAFMNELEKANLKVLRQEYVR